MDAPPVQYVRTSDGYDIAYAVFGSGLPLLWLPFQFNDLSQTWALQAYRTAHERAAQQHQLILYDARGQGMSSRGLPENLTVQDFERDIEAVLRAVGLNRVAVYGIGAFGAVALSYAVHRPEVVAGVIVDNYVDLKNTESGAQSMMHDLAAEDWEFYLQNVRRIFFPDQDPETSRAFMAKSVTQADYLKLRSVFHQFDVSFVLEKVTMPALVIANKRIVSREATARRLSSGIAGARLVTIDGPTERPKATAAFYAFMDGLDRRASADTDDGVADELLSPREVEVLRLIASGRSNAQIAEALVISPNTVGRHVSNIFDKTGAANRAEATAYAMRNGLA